MKSPYEPLPYKESDVVGVSPYVRLRRESNKITVAYVPHMTLQYGVARPEHAIVFALFDGKRTFGEVVRMTACIAGKGLESACEIVTDTVRFITPDLEMMVKAGEGALGSLPSPEDLIIPHAQVDLNTRLEAPLVMLLQPTLMDS